VDETTRAVKNAAATLREEKKRLAMKETSRLESELKKETLVTWALRMG